MQEYLYRIGFKPEIKEIIICKPVFKPAVTTQTSERLISAIVDPENSILSFRECSIKLTVGGRPDTAKIIKHGTQISVLISIKGKQFVVTLIGIIIANCYNYFNVIRGMSEDQQADLAFDLVEEFWYLKLEDFVAFFAMVKKSSYGRILDRLDAGLIMDWFKKYLFQREEDIVKINPSYEYEEPRENRPEDGMNRTLATVSTVKEWAKTADTLRKNLDPKKQK